MFCLRTFSLKLLVPVLVLLSLKAHAEKPTTIKLSTFQIPLMVESPTKGLFIALTKEIARKQKLQIQIEMMPVAKSLLAFSSGEVDGFFPAHDLSVSKDAARSILFYEKIDYIFYRKDHKPLITIKDLEGKKVGLTFRFTYPSTIMNNKRVNIEYAPDDIENMKKLGNGDIDAFIAEERSGLKALELSKMSNVSYDKKTPFSKMSVYYAFQNTEKGKKLAQDFTQAIESLKSSGVYDQIIFNLPPKILE